ncbi:MAG TPA: hypothetical protein VJI96_01090 [Candidatus Andersenbacteria bacterium]|nr:hypothetical protein [Candidatus Andersenbacteria bacterium]
MSSILTVFQDLDITDPIAWLTNERLSKQPSEGSSEIWFNLGSFLGKDAAMCRLTKSALERFGVRISKDEDSRFLPLLKLLSDDVGVFEVFDDSVLLVSKNTDTLDGGLYVSFSDDEPFKDGGIYGYHALYASWEINPDRDAGHEARNFLCNKVEPLIKQVIIKQEVSKHKHGITL